MAKRDFYEVLGVGKSADEKDLKAAYRNLAKQFHPDANPGDKTAEAKFKEINEAYDVLKDPQKKAAYDRFGHQAFEGGMGGGRGPGGAGFGPEFNSSMSDIFEDLFGDFMGGGGRSRRGGTGRGGTGASRGALIGNSLCNLLAPLRRCPAHRCVDPKRPIRSARRSVRRRSGGLGLGWGVVLGLSAG